MFALSAEWPGYESVYNGKLCMYEKESRISTFPLSTVLNPQLSHVFVCRACTAGSTFLCASPDVRCSIPYTLCRLLPPSPLEGEHHASSLPGALQPAQDTAQVGVGSVHLRHQRAKQLSRSSVMTSAPASSWSPSAPFPLPPCGSRPCPQTPACPAQCTHSSTHKRHTRPQCVRWKAPENLTPHHPHPPPLLFH